jgi:CMP-N,N'-diacetyllegionaminic acid synthase
MKVYKNLVYIPCKSKSQRLPNKNFLNFNGKKLCQITFDQVKKIEFEKFVVIDTDNIKLLNYVKKYNFYGFKRKLSDTKKNTKTSECLFKVIKYFEKKKIIFENIILLQVTSPLRTSIDINNAYRYFLNKKANSIISVCKTFVPVEWVNTLNAKKEMNFFLKKKNLNIMSQNFETKYQINGAIYIAKLKSFLKYKSFYNIRGSFAYVMSRSSSVDIDDKFDFNLAKLIYKNKKIFK